MVAVRIFCRFGCMECPGHPLLSALRTLRRLWFEVNASCEPGWQTGWGHRGQQGQAKVGRRLWQRSIPAGDQFSPSPSSSGGVQRHWHCSLDLDQPCRGTPGFPNSAKKPVDLASGFLPTPVRSDPERPASRARGIQGERERSPKLLASAWNH